jgi:hypothetical protein
MNTIGCGLTTLSYFLLLLSIFFLILILHLRNFSVISFHNLNHLLLHFTSIIFLLVLFLRLIIKTVSLSSLSSHRSYYLVLSILLLSGQHSCIIIKTSQFQVSAPMTALLTHAIPKTPGQYLHIRGVPNGDAAELQPPPQTLKTEM